MGQQILTLTLGLFLGFIDKMLKNHKKIRSGIYRQYLGSDRVEIEIKTFESVINACTRQVTKLKSYRKKTIGVRVK